MSQFFHETAHNKTDLKKYGENLESIFGVKPSPFCDKCEKRHAFCECNLDEAYCLSCDTKITETERTGYFCSPCFDSAKED